MPYNEVEKLFKYHYTTAPPPEEDGSHSPMVRANLHSSFTLLVTYANFDNNMLNLFHRNILIFFHCDLDF